jgi:deoxyribodipyrimidine photo-lyase
MNTALTPEAAWAALGQAQPAQYAKTRNHVEGAVTGLSAHITHGVITVPEVVAALKLPVQHKLMFQLAWREYFQWVWQHEGEGILSSLHAGPLPDAA